MCQVLLQHLILDQRSSYTYIYSSTYIYIKFIREKLISEGCEIKAKQYLGYLSSI